VNAPNTRASATTPTSWESSRDDTDRMKLVLLRERIPDGFKQLPGKSDRIAGQIPVTCGMRRLACPPRHSCYRSP
jgi:hypothetical protein